LFSFSLFDNDLHKKSAMKKCFIWLLSWLSNDKFQHAKLILRNLAKLHASFWKSPLLDTFNVWRHGTRTLSQY
jgi:hypothetical protein